jgi:hypothetical protein
MRMHPPMKYLVHDHPALLHLFARGITVTQCARRKWPHFVPLRGVSSWPSMLLLQAHFDSKLSSRRKKLANSVSKALTGQERQKVRR